MSEILKLEKVSKRYCLDKIRIDVLKEINLTINKGDFVVILGPSGSGKSTLLNLVSCLDVPSEGNIFFEKQDVSFLSEDELANIRGKKIGFVFQQFNLLPYLNALENVIIPTIFQGMSENERKTKAKDILSLVGLKDRIFHRPSELSGGEKQRVAIARALINNPDIIVADEPTGNVDSKTGEKIMKIIQDLNKNGKTIIVVTHDIELTRYANRVIKIKDGEIQND
jgi:putative ABC transport system ATP-binding protein